MRRLVDRPAAARRGAEIPQPPSSRPSDRRDCDCCRERTGTGEPLEPGRRIGTPWLGWGRGRCRYRLSGRENLCDLARFTGRDIDGGFAELTLADERYCFASPEGYSDLQVAPLLCAGLIGYRALGMTGDAERLGLYGFGSSAHIIAQVARFQGLRVFAFTCPGDEAGQTSARELSVEWVGDSLSATSEELDAAIIFASAGELVPTALRAPPRVESSCAPGFTRLTSRASPTTSCGESGPFARPPTSPASMPTSSWPSRPASTVRTEIHPYALAGRRPRPGASPLWTLAERRGDRLDRGRKSRLQVRARISCGRIAPPQKAGARSALTVSRPDQASCWLRWRRRFRAKGAVGLGACRGVWSMSRRGHSRYALLDDEAHCAAARRDATAVRRIFALAAAAESGDQFDHCVKRGLEWLGVAFDLREEQAALQGG